MKRLRLKQGGGMAENLQVVMQLGLTMAGCIVFCLFVGLKIDAWVGMKGPFTALFTLLGIFGGATVCYRQINEILAPPQTPPDNGKNQQELLDSKENGTD